jgi:hypothetical protein
MTLQEFHQIRNYFFDELVKANLIKDTDKNFTFVDNLLSQLFKIKEY